MKLIAASLFVALFLLVACSSGGLTMEDFNKLEVGMQVSEAESILGLKLEGVKETTYLGLPLTTGRFGPADGPHIDVIVQDGEIRQLDPVDLK